MKRVPNILTFFRLLIAPIIVIIFYLPFKQPHLYALVIFCIGAFTDYLDGLIARRYKVITNLGKLLDPLADKLLVITVLVMLIAQRSHLTADPWVSPWMVVMLIARELWITGLRGVLAAKGVVLSAKEGGKIKSALQMIAVVFLLWHYQVVEVFGINLSGEHIGNNLLLLSLVFSYTSAYTYTVNSLEVILDDD